MNTDFSTQLTALFPRLMGYAIYLCGNRDEAEDLRSEAICRILEGLQHYDPARGGLKAYCMAVMMNIYRVAYNRNKLWGQFVETNRQPQQYEIETAQDYRFIVGECRRVEVIMCADGFSYDEIASAQNIPIGTVKSRIHDERKRLAKLLTPDMRKAESRKRAYRKNHLHNELSTLM